MPFLVPPLMTQGSLGNLTTWKTGTIREKKVMKIQDQTDLHFAFAWLIKKLNLGKSGQNNLLVLWLGRKDFTRFENFISWFVKISELLGNAR